VRRQRGAVDIFGILIVLLGIGAAAAGYFAWSYWSESALLEKRLKQAEADFARSIKVRDDLIRMKASGQNVSADETNTIQTYFHETAQAHKFTINKINPGKSRYKDTWDEQSYRIEIKNISRQQLGNFVADVELNKPFLKSKEIRDVRFDDNHYIQSATVVFSHYTRARK